MEEKTINITVEEYKELLKLAGAYQHLYNEYNVLIKELEDMANAFLAEEKEKCKQKQIGFKIN